MAKPTKVLIIDDDEGILDAVKAVLEYENFDVSTNSNGQKIIGVVEKTTPDIILLDLLLSGKDGKEVASEIRSNDSTKKIPIIMLSAHPNVKADAELAGANDFLAKPFDINELLSKIRSHTKK